MIAGASSILYNRIHRLIRLSLSSSATPISLSRDSLPRPLRPEQQFYRLAHSMFPQICSRLVIYHHVLALPALPPRKLFRVSCLSGTIFHRYHLMTF